MELSWIQKLAVWIIPVLFAITLHEVAHGWVANRFGDGTARIMGRLTLNPLKHIDPIGTLVVPMVMFLLVGFMFGWAKPVPVDWRNLRNPKKDMVWVAFAGPASNFLMAVFWALIIRLGLMLHSGPGDAALFLILMGTAGVFINTILFLLNLIPVPPLDGGRILVGLLPNQAAIAVSKLEPYGLFIIVALLLMGGLGIILSPFISVFTVLFAAVAGIEPQLLLSGLLQAILPSH